MADLTSGSTIRALDTPTTVMASDLSNITSFTNTTSANGSPVVGVAFVAPTTGRVMISVNASIQAVSGQVFAGAIVRTGATVGSGTVVSSPDAEPTARLACSTGILTASCMVLVSGLTPGSAYNACVGHFTTGTGTLYHRVITVSPST